MCIPLAAACLFTVGCYWSTETSVTAPKPTAPTKPVVAPLEKIEAPVPMEEEVVEMEELATPVDFTFPTDAVGKTLEAEVTPPRGITGPVVPAVVAPRPWLAPPAERTIGLPMRSTTPLAWKYEPRLLPREQGWVKEIQPATDQPPLGLSDEPLRPALPPFAVSALAKGAAIPSPADPLPEARLADQKPATTDDPTRDVAFAVRCPPVGNAGLHSPAAERGKIADPTENIVLIQLRQPIADLEAPAFIPAGPAERPVLPVAP